MWRFVFCCLVFLSSARCGPTQAVIDVDVTGLTDAVVEMQILARLNDADPMLPINSIKMNFDHFQIRVAQGQLGVMKIDLITKDALFCDVSTAAKELNLESAGNYSITMDLTARPGCTLVLRKTGDGSGEVSLSDGTLYSFSRVFSAGPTCPIQNTAYTIEQKQFNPGAEVTLTGEVPTDSRRETYFAGWSGACSGVSACSVKIDEHQRVVDAGFLPTVVCSEDRVCWENPRPQGTALFRVRGRSASDVWAIGDSGRILHWNGSYWSAPRRPEVPRALYGLWIQDARNIVAVGSDGMMVRLEDDAWACPAQQGTTSLYDIYGATADNLWAIGEQGGLLHFDGSSWTRVAVPSGTTALRTVRGTSASDIFAVGEKGTVLHYDGTTWSQIAFPSTETLSDVWMLGVQDAWIVGDKGLTAHIVGSTVTLGSTGTSSNLYGVWGSSASDLWAVGERGAIARYDGTTWAAVESSTTLHLRSVWGTGISDVWAVGDGGTIIHFNGTLWLPVSATRGSDSLNAVWGPTLPGATGSSIVYAVGDRGLGLLWSGADWITAPFSSMTPRHLYGIWGTSSDDVWIVGEAGEIIHSSGPSSIRVNSSTTVDLFAVWGSAANNLLAVGQGGRLARYDGANWSSMNLPQAGGASLRSIYGTSATSVWLVGDGGTILNWNGVMATPFSSGVVRSLRGVWALGGEAWAVGDGGTILRFSGGQWSVHGQSGMVLSNLLGVYGSATNDVWATGEAGILLHYDGKSWGLVKSGCASVLKAIWSSFSEGTIAVGQSASILRYRSPMSISM